MSFNPDPKKQARETIFSTKNSERLSSISFFDGTVMEQLTSQKHLGIHLDKKLDFNVLIKEKISKANRGIGLIKKQQSKLCIPSKYFELRAWGREANWLFSYPAMA